MAPLRPQSLKTLLARVAALTFALVLISALVGWFVVIRAYRTEEAGISDRVSKWVRGTLEERALEARETVEGRGYSEAAVALTRPRASSEARLRFENEQVGVLQRRNFTVLLLFDSSRAPKFAWFRPGSTASVAALPAEQLLALTDSIGSVGGFVRWGTDVYRIGATPLHAPDGRRSGGYVVVGAPLDPQYLQVLLRSISLPLHLELDETLVDRSKQRVVGDSLLLLEPLHDVFGAPLVTARLAVDRRAQHLRFLVGLALIAVVFFGGTLVSWMFWRYGRRLLLDPLEQTVRDIDAMRDAREVTELSLGLGVSEWEVLRTAFNTTSRALREFQRRYRDVFDRAADPLFLLEPGSGRVVEANPATMELTGVPADEIIGQTLPAELAPTGVGHRVFRYRRPDGVSLTWELASSEVAFEGGTWTLAAYHDLTGREAMAHSQKMEAVGMLAGGIAHDFNNLLGAVLTGATAARVLVGPDHQAGAALDGIEHAGMRAAELTRQLLRFSRHDPLRLSPVDMGRAVEAVRSICARTFDRSITIDVAAEPEVPAVLGDAGEIEQSLLNLCINARDAMPGGGHLQIELGQRVLDADQARHAGVPAAGTFVTLAVQDDGTGMTDEVKARFFEPFFTTKEPGKGTGLGMPIVYGLARQLGGAVSVQSTLGTGTRIELLLPALADRDARRVTPPQSTRGVAEVVRAAASDPSAGHGRPLVLLVDDERTLREMLRMVLNLSGYDVVEAADGHQALELFAEHRTDVRAVLLDVQLPGGMSGVDTLERIRALDAAIPVVLCTGFARDEEMARLRRLAVDDVLLKPLDLQLLLERLRTLTRSGSPRRA
ncbi:MAG: response regulator [Gemmatimonadetes bacterium]|nr:response regulator [Gemmatimonadota bacterium]